MKNSDIKTTLSFVTKGSKKTSEKSSSKTSKNRAKAEINFHSINRVSLQELSRIRFRELLKEAFPGTDAHTAEAVHKTFGVSKRQVKNWLACENSPPFDVVFGIGCLIGVFRVAEVMTRGQGRQTILNKIISGVSRVVS